MVAAKRGQATEKPVPEELGGLSEDTIRDIMSELPEEEEEIDSGELAPETQPEEEEVAEPDEELDTPGEEQEQVDPKSKETTVPYDALHEERQKRKQATKQLEEQDRLIKELQQRLVALEQKPAEKPSEPEDEEEQEEGSTYHNQLFDEAEKEFERRYKRSPDDLSGRDMVILNRIASDIDTAVRNHYTRQMAEAQERQKIYSDYAKEITAKPDFKEIVGFVTKRVEEMPPLSRDHLLAAYQRAETGKGSLEDIIMVRQFWEASEALFRLSNPNAAPEDAGAAKSPAKAAVKTAEKIEKMAAHPRSASIPSAGTSGGALSVAELERLLNTEDWERIPPEVQRLLKGG